MKLAFWNICRRIKPAVRLARHADPDVLALAECPPDARAGLADALLALDPGWRHLPETIGRVTVFARGDAAHPESRITRYAAAITLDLGGRPWTLIAVHLPSRMHLTPDKIASTAVLRLRDEILEVEQRAGHRRTVLVGDFNLDPFDLGLSSQGFLWGAMDRRLARRLARRTGDVRDAVFYNPMWSRLGDDSPGPPGTDYVSNDSDRDYCFHTFDQVMIRPEFAAALGAIDVPRALDGAALVSANDLPRRAEASDHLPVVFELD